MSPRGSIAAAALLAASCRAETSPGQGASGPPARAEAAAAAVSPQAQQARPAESLAERLDAIDAAVRRWRNANDLADARRNAEAVRNLIVGRGGPFYGDADGDGEIAGASEVGLLPGLRGEAGLASAAPNACVTRDVLGGDWSDSAGRWQTLGKAIADWKPAMNTYPKLPSHPQRVVGWATVALGAKELSAARDHARHAQLHVDISKRALHHCGA